MAWCGHTATSRTWCALRSGPTHRPEGGAVLGVRVGGAAGVVQQLPARPQDGGLPQGGARLHALRAPEAQRQGCGHRHRRGRHAPPRGPPGRGHALPAPHRIRSLPPQPPDRGAAPAAFSTPLSPPGGGPALGAPPRRLARRLRRGRALRAPCRGRQAQGDRGRGRGEGGEGGERRGEGGGGTCRARRGGASGEPGALSAVLPEGRASPGGVPGPVCACAHRARRRDDALQSQSSPIPGWLE